MVARAIAEAVSSMKPRCPPSALHPDALLLCGLEPMRITAETNFVNIGKTVILIGSYNSVLTKLKKILKPF